MRAVWIAGLLLAIACSPDQAVTVADFADADVAAVADGAVSAGYDGLADFLAPVDAQDVPDVPPDVAPDIPVNPCATKPCDDANPCTTDTCAAGQCLHVPITDGMPCSDNNACTQPDFCSQGTCAGSLACDSHATCAPSSGCTCALGWFGSGWACQPWLSGISLNGQPVAGFQDGVFSYNVNLPLGTQTATVTIDAPTGVLLTVNGVSVKSGVASEAIALSVGVTNTVVVTCSAGGVQATYTIQVARGFQEAYVKASTNIADLWFGYGMAISGDTLVVGAPNDSSLGKGVNASQTQDVTNGWASGAVYVFVRVGGNWSFQAYLKASNPDLMDFFGGSVAIDGDLLVVGAGDPIVSHVGEGSKATGINGDQGDNSAPYAGAAYVFVRNGTTWSQQAYLKADNTAKDQEFGAAVAVSGETVVVGQPHSDKGKGRAYVFARAGDIWSQQTMLQPSQSAGGAFGSSVSIDGDTVVVGAALERTMTGDGGAAYVFTRTGGIWSEQAYIRASNHTFGDQFGRSAALSGNTLVVGAAGESSKATGVGGDQSDTSLKDAGAAYVFTRTAGVWGQQAYLKASNTNAKDEFGLSVAIAGDRVAVGAIGESSQVTGLNGDASNNSAPGAGAAYLFVRAAGVWSQFAYLKASNPDAGDLFGGSVALWGDTVVVGAARPGGGEASNATGINGNQADNSMPGAGAVYVFR